MGLSLGGRPGIHWNQTGSRAMRKFNDDNNDRIIPEDVRIQLSAIRIVLYRAVTAMQTKDVGNMLDKLSQVIDTIGEQKELLKELEELEEDNNEVGFY